MIRQFIILVTGLLLFATSGAAQELRALARADLDASGFEQTQDGVTLRLVLSQGVPYRIKKLADPRRLRLEFRELDLSADFAGLTLPSAIEKLTTRRTDPGWTALDFHLTQPLAVQSAALKIDQSRGKATLSARFTPESAEVFDASAITLPPTASALAAAQAPDKPIIVLDPGHGGVDPGAQREGFDEADLMLQFAVELRDVLLRRGLVEVVLTRTEDVFVSLPARVSLAREANASAFLSLHADALAQGRASGTTVYTLSKEASDTASAALAARQDRQDIIRGVDLTALDDDVAVALMDLARSRTSPRSRALAGQLVDELRQTLGKLHKRPLMEAGFSVLKAPDIPSVLVELGFMSSAQDLKNLTDPVWRSLAADGMANAIEAWVAENG